MSLLQLSLRMMLWILFLAAVITGWGWERWGLLGPIQEAEEKGQFLLGRQVAVPSQSALDRRGTLERLAGLSEEEFRRELAPKLEPKSSLEDLWLIEMARRKMIPELQQLLEAASHNENAYDGDVELLTALRRAEGKPDPVRIEVALTDRDQEGKPLPVPHIAAVVRNRDAERRAWSMHCGGDYRSGRLERWRVELTDERGERVLPSNFVSFHFGGIGTTQKIEFGESTKWNYVMDPRRYVGPPPTGRYQLQLFHSNGDISDEYDTTGLIVWKSEPVWVDVVNHDEATFDATLIRLGVTMLLALGALGIGYWFTPRSAESDSRPIPWIDMAFCALVVGLSIGWWFDGRHLRDYLARLQPDAEKNWTMAQPAGGSTSTPSPTQ